MKYVVFSYNMLTLCRSLRYIDEVWGKENSTIIYADLVSPVPDAIKNDYDVVTIDTDSLEATKRGFSLIFGSCRCANKAWKILDRIVADANDEVTLVVFRDNQPQEATLIERFHKKYSDKGKIILIEEGSMIYAKKRVPIRYQMIKKIIYSLYGVSLYSLLPVPHGDHKYISKIICVNPDLYKKRNSLNRDVDVEKMINIFVESFNNYIIESVTGKKCEEFPKFDYVYLTQPYTDYREEYEKIMDISNDLLPKIFGILNEHGRTIIKPHPRESMDYSVYVNENVELVSEKEQFLPFECLMQLYGNPQQISMCSSVSISNKSDKQSIYTFRMFDIPNDESCYHENYFSDNNIVVCDNLTDFSNALL